MRAKDIIGLILALLFALGIAILSRMFLMGDEKDEAAEVQTVVQKAKTVDILISRQHLNVGKRLSRVDVRWQPWPQASVNAAYLTKEEVEIKDLEGSIVRYPLSQGEPLTLEDIIRPGDRSVLSAIIDSGRRGVSINVNAATSNSGLIKPGDFVDVILSKSEMSFDGATNIMSSEVVVYNVRILAIDQHMGGDSKVLDKMSKSIPKTATLELTPAQAETLVSATQQGELFLSLHSLTADGTEQICPGGICEKETGSDYTIMVIRGAESQPISVKNRDETAMGSK